MGNPTYFVDDAAVTAREAEVVNASFDNGMNMGGSNACGIGINIDEGAVVGTPEQFTLLDQHGDARTAQISQSLGGYPYVASSAYPSSGGQEGTSPDAVVRTGSLPTQAAKDADSDLKGTIIAVGNATLASLAAGWVAV
jgi:hypothetical protein